MSLEQLFIFDKIHDELVFYVNNPNTVIYKSKKKIKYRGEKNIFYVLRRKCETIDPEDSIAYLYAEDDNYAEFYRQAEDLSEAPQNVIMLLLSAPNALSGQLQNLFTTELNDQIAHIHEIDLEQSSRSDYGSFFAEERGIILCEEFEMITIEELLDCEI
jgi:hypothetical protein